MPKHAFRIHVVAELVGVSENLLRAWERRYQLVTPARSPSGYRAYSNEDVELLRKVKRLTDDGMAIGDVARQLPQLRAAVAREAAQRPVDAPDERPLAPVVPLPVQTLAGWRQAMLASTEKNDQGAIARTLDEASTRLSPVALAEELVAPVLVEVGERWVRGELSVAQEHLVTHAVRSKLLQLFERLPRGDGARVLCATLPGDEHEVGLLMAALRFREAGWQVTFLGANTPVEEIGRMGQALHPVTVALSCTQQVSEAEVLRRVLAVRELLPLNTRVVVGGRGALPHASALSRVDVTVATTPPATSIFPEARRQP